MTIRFSPAFGGASPAIAQALCGTAPLNGANDNTTQAIPAQATAALADLRADIHLASPANANAPAPTMRIDPLVERALRHFADHGLAAARVARERAEAARREGDQPQSDHWIDICRQLDRRMARGFAHA